MPEQPPDGVYCIGVNRLVLDEHFEPDWDKRDHYVTDGAGKKLFSRADLIAGMRKQGSDKLKASFQYPAGHKHAGYGWECVVPEGVAEDINAMVRGCRKKGEWFYVVDERATSDHPCKRLPIKRPHYPPDVDRTIGVMPPTDEPMSEAYREAEAGMAKLWLAASLGPT